MLKSLDILIGLSVIMLVLSMAVTLINQVLFSLFASRGRHLREGLSDLLVLLDTGLTRADTDELAARVLSHPLVRANVSLPGWIARFLPGFQFGEVIHREELVKLLLMFGEHYADAKAALNDLQAAANGGAGFDEALAKLTTALGKLDLTNESGRTDNAADMQQLGGILKSLADGAADPATRAAKLAELQTLLGKIYGVFSRLHTALEANEIGAPGQILKQVRERALQLEQTHPELTNDIRVSQAFLEEASTEFLAKVHLNFDQFMDRVSARFTYHTRAVTVITSAVLVVLLQLDTVGLVNRLAMDDKMREAFVEQAVTMTQDEAGKSLALTKPVPSPAATPATTTAQPGSAASPQPTPSEALATNPPPDIKKNAETEKLYWSFLAKQGVIVLPEKGKWCESWKKVSPPGILVSILLLSLGAPFWYKTLGQLVQFRTALAQRDQEQRNRRQSVQESDADGGDNPGGAG